MKIKLLLEYEGTHYAGWQRQTGQRTVQGELERALEIALSSLARRSKRELLLMPTLTASGRTDAGVHARGQVVSFHWPEDLILNEEKLRLALDGLTPPDIGVLALETAADDFDARRTPSIKHYRYQLQMRRGGSPLLAKRCWQVPRGLAIEDMIKAARQLCGTHDFRAFRASDCNSSSSVRTISLSELSRIDGELLAYSVQGNGFLKQMVRTIVGGLLQVGLRRLSSNDFRLMLESGERAKGIETAPAYGLTLERVQYELP